MVRTERSQELFDLKRTETMTPKLVPHNTNIKLLVICAALFVTASCSSGGDSQGFCRRWANVMERVKNNEINSSDELVSAISTTELGDPGGSLSEFRESLENEIRFGTSDGALQYTDLISDLCTDLE